MVFVVVTLLVLLLEAALSGSVVVEISQPKTLGLTAVVVVVLPVHLLRYCNCRCRFLPRPSGAVGAATTVRNHSIKNRQAPSQIDHTVHTITPSPHPPTAVGKADSGVRAPGPDDTPGGAEAGARALRHQASCPSSAPAAQVHIGAGQEEAARAAGGPPQGARPDVAAGAVCVFCGWKVRAMRSKIVSEHDA